MAEGYISNSARRTAGHTAHPPKDHWGSLLSNTLGVGAAMQTENESMSARHRGAPRFSMSWLVITMGAVKSLVSSK